MWVSVLALSYSPPPLTMMFGVWQVCQPLPVLRKIHRRRRKRVVNTPAWQRKTKRLTSGLQNIVLLGAWLWQHAFNYCWILQLIFVSGVSPGGRLDLSMQTWENSQACNKICLFAASQIVKSSRIYKSNAGFPFKPCFHSHSSFLCSVALHFQAEIELFSSPEYQLQWGLHLSTFEHF